MRPFLLAKWTLRIAAVLFAVLGMWTAGSCLVREIQFRRQEPLEYPTDVVAVRVGYNDSAAQLAMFHMVRDAPYAGVLEIYEHDGQQSVFAHISGARKKHVFAVSGVEVRYRRGKPPIELKPTGGVPLAMR